MHVENLSRHRPLRIGLLSYRGNPFCGGQGVYVRHLSHALEKLGHAVDVISGPPYPNLDNGARLHRLPGLDLYNPQALFRTPSIKELCDPVNVIEWLGVSTMGFPEPLAFGLRARRFIGSQRTHYDVIHDNQSLSYSIWALAKQVPLVATIHHPITVDRDTAIRAQRTFLKKIQQWRWYSFIGMQKRVARALRRIITMSQRGRTDISRAFKISRDHISVVPNGIDSHNFHPLPGVAREPNRLIVTTSSDTPLKGLDHLLTAVAALTATYPRLKLIIVGAPAEDSLVLPRIRRLGLSGHVRFTGRIPQLEYVRQYARATAAIVPSVYEGFGLPAGEAMACGVPVISTSGGALPEVLGDTGYLVPPSDPAALTRAIAFLLEHPETAQHMGRLGRERVITHFTWEKAAQKTVAAYDWAIRDHHRLHLP